MRAAGVILALAGLSGAAGMVLAALTAHPASTGGPLPEAGRLVDAALRYHLLHAAALVALAAAAAATGGRWPWAVALCWIGGTLMFSGGLYLRAFADIASLGPIVPIGGALYILGWVLLAVVGGLAAIRAGRR
ncbi:MAG: DUF423 domain-containing protein [Bauldia litoralis]